MGATVLLVEDDALSAKLIERNLIQFPDYELVCTASSLKDAINFLENNTPELVIMDIELPDGKGFDLIPYLTGSPKIVVLTGDESYAFTAFESGAIDFLKKPVTPARFKSCLDKIGLITKPVTTTNTDKPYLFVKSGYKHVRITIDELLFAEAVGDYVKLYLTGKKTLLINISLKELMTRLQGYSFAQVHRSYLINLQHIDSVDDEGITFGDQLVPVGKTYKQSLQKILK